MNLTDVLLCAAQDGRCFYCPTEFTGPLQHGKARSPSQWTRDHVVPRTAGGTDLTNRVLSCEPCNSRKGYRMPTNDEIRRAEVLHLKVIALGKAICGTGYNWGAPPPTPIPILKADGVASVA